MKVNFLPNLKNDSGTLVFFCQKNKKLEKYLESLNKKPNLFINKAIKISQMEYNNNSYTDIILPQNSKADRIILLGIDKSKLKSEYDFGTLGSNITTILNKKKNYECKGYTF